MTFSDPRIVQFPPPLRELITAELANGNSIAEIASCFPAPPAGAYCKLARPVTTRPRTTTAELSYYDRNSSLYSGEWTDERRFYFVIEPPRPPAPEPDMDAIRTARNSPPPVKAASTGSRAATTLIERFRESMRIDYEKWHDGIGYDLSLIDAASPAERKVIEVMLISRGVNDWRDVEALARVNSLPARKALRRAMMNGNVEVRGAVIRFAPKLVNEDDRTTFLVEALRTARFYGGLSDALDQVPDYHPPEVVAELLRGTLERSGDVAVHFAAMLMFIHGKAKDPFDWSHRPFYLRFDAATRAERETVFRELCERIGVNADEYLRAPS
jgi:hypothetical protein